MGYLSYKGYTGSVEYSEEDNCLFGKVQGMTKDSITYEGATVDELAEDFHGAVDDYLQLCEEKGITINAFINYSVVGFSTRNYGGQTLQLHASPDADSPVTFSFSEEMQLHPVGVVDGWVKVKTDDGKHSGWIQDEWICDNPLTNCC